MASEPKEPSAFLRALGDMLAGARHAQEIAQVVVTEAVQATLALIARDYPLDYSQLLARYQADVVRSCCAMLDDTGSGVACTAATKTGRPCTKRAVINGVCAQHVGAWHQQQAALRRQDSYAAVVRHAASHEPHATELQQLKEVGRRRTVAMALPETDGVARAMC